MKKSEKTELTKEKIFAAALYEFGTKGYDSASLNHICSDNGISKGLIYHNYQGKDDLYLRCVSYALSEYIRILKEEKQDGMGVHKYLEIRYHFFSKHPLLSRLFFEAILQPPRHLAEQIKELKREFEQLNINIYRASLEHVTLREGVTEQEAVEYFSIMQEMFNGYFSSTAYADADFSTVVSDHEAKMKKLLNFMLYGVAKEEIK